MEAFINTDSKGNILVHVKGGLNYENTGPLREQIKGLMKKNPRCTVTLDLNNLDFVGSSGIGQFVDMIKDMREDGRLKLMNVKPEFLQVFKLYELSAIETLLNDFDRDETLDLGLWANRRRTFEN